MLSSEVKLQIEDQVIQIGHAIAIFEEIEKYFDKSKNESLQVNAEHILLLLESGESIIHSAQQKLQKMIA